MLGEILRVFWHTVLLDVRADRNFQFTTWNMDLYIEIINLYARKNVTGYRYLNAVLNEI